MIRAKNAGFSLLAVMLAGMYYCRAAGPARPEPIRTGEHYEIYGRSEGGKLVLEIVPTDGWKLNLKAPLRLKVTSSGTIKPERELWTGKDARRLEEKLCRLEIAFAGAGPGVWHLEFDFVLCSDTLCQKKKFSFDYRFSAE
jgi:hypothetical protein